MHACFALLVAEGELNILMYSTLTRRQNVTQQRSFTRAVIVENEKWHHHHRVSYLLLELLLSGLAGKKVTATVNELQQ